MPEILAIIFIIAAFFVGKWSGRLEAERKHAESMATRLADEYEETVRRNRQP